MLGGILKRYRIEGGDTQTMVKSQESQESLEIFQSLADKIYSADKLKLQETEYEILMNYRENPVMLSTLIRTSLAHPLTMRTQQMFDIISQFPIKTAQDYLLHIHTSTPVSPSDRDPDLIHTLFQIFVRDYNTAERNLTAMEVSKEKKLQQYYRFIQGICFEVQEKLLLAAPLFQELTDQDPSNALFWYHRGIVAFKARHLQEAREFFTQAQNSDMDQFVYPVIHLINIDLEEFQYSAARQRLDQFKTIDPKNSWIQFEYGNLATLEEDFVEALKYFRNAVETSPFQPQIWKNIGVIYLEMGEFDDAWETLEILQELYPRRLTSWIGMAWFWRFQNNPQKALDYLNEGLLHVPHAFEIYLEMAKCYRSMAGEGEAFQEFRILQLGLKEHPTNFRLRLALGEYYLAYEDLEAAKSIFLTLLEEDPIFTPATLKLAQAEENYAFATIESMYKQIIAREPHNFEAWLGLGDFYFRETKLINADEALQKAYDLNSQHIHLNHILGILTWGFHGDLKKAESFLQYALDHEEANIMIAINLADLYLNEFHDTAKAIQIATKYLKLDPKNEILQQILAEANRLK